MARPIRHVALLLEQFASDWQRHLLRGVQTFAQASSYWRLHVQVGQSGASRFTSESVRLDGVISALVRAHAVLRELHRQPDIQFVGVVSSPRHTLDMPIVQADNGIVAAKIGQHLLSGGFRRLAYFGYAGWGHPDPRADAMRAFAAANEVPFHLFQPTQARKFDLDLSFPTRQFVQWVATLNKPVGIVAWNMVSAQRVVQACVRAGVAVPRDVAVVACDDDPLIGETSAPTISGMLYSAERIALHAAELLDRMMDGAAAPVEPVSVPMPKILYVRQSSDVINLPDRDVYRAVQYIREHVKESLKVEHVARAVGVSRSGLDEKFLRVLGHTPHEELIRAHITRAEQFLVQTPWTMSRIAEESGFGTRQRMHRVFCERCGQSPADYRKQFGSQDTTR